MTFGFVLNRSKLHASRQRNAGDQAPSTDADAALVPSMTVLPPRHLYLFSAPQLVTAERTLGF